jgi:hypothetical protein
VNYRFSFVQVVGYIPNLVLVTARNGFLSRAEIGRADMNQQLRSEPGALIPKSNLARELGVSSRTLSRWLADIGVGFPRPVIIRGRNYFDRGSIEVWKTAQLRASLKGGAA